MASASSFKDICIGFGKRHFQRVKSTLRSVKAAENDMVNDAPLEYFADNREQRDRPYFGQIILVTLT
jgi:hypothetical protein